jgi:hypothetical protein
MIRLITLWGDDGGNAAAHARNAARGSGRVAGRAPKRARLAAELPADIAAVLIRSAPRGRRNMCSVAGCSAWSSR